MCLTADHIIALFSHLFGCFRETLLHHSFGFAHLLFVCTECEQGVHLMKMKTKTKTHTNTPIYIHLTHTNQRKIDECEISLRNLFMDIPLFECFAIRHFTLAKNIHTPHSTI